MSRFRKARQHRLSTITDEEDDRKIDVSVSRVYEDLSIAIQTERIFDELVAPPEVEVPIREYSQRSSFSGIPDGTTLHPDTGLPIGETIDKFFARLSRAAKQAWDLWIKPEPEEVLLTNGTTIKPLGRPIDEALLTKEEATRYLRFKRLRKVETGHFQKEEDSYANRLISESFLTSLKDDDELLGQIPDDQRFFLRQKIERDPVGNIKVINEKIDRCQNKEGITDPNLRRVLGTSTSTVAISGSNPSYQERLEHITNAELQTEIWRKPVRAERDNYIPNVTPQDDPDFNPPLSSSKKNFNIWPPASRPYNIVFKVVYEDRRVEKIYPATKKGVKDYTSLSSIIYLHDIRKVQYKSIQIDELRSRPGQEPRPNCKFEVDLRVTYSKDLRPDPNNYKKVDPNSVLGMNLISKLNEQPYLFEEFKWDYEDSDEDGKTRTTKKIAVGYVINHPSEAKRRVYWVYIDEKKNTIGKPKFLKPMRVAPQVLYRPLCYYSTHLRARKEYPFLATIRVSEGYYFFDKREKRYKSFDEVKEAYFNMLLKQSYLFVKQVPENDYTNVQLFHFVHKSTRTKEQRTQIFLSFNNKNHV